MILDLSLFQTFGAYEEKAVLPSSVLVDGVVNIIFSDYLVL